MCSKNMKAFNGKFKTWVQKTSKDGLRLRTHRLYFLPISFHMICRIMVMLVLQHVLLCVSNVVFSRIFSSVSYFPTGNYLLNVNNRNSRTRCEVCSKLTIKTSERLQCRRFVIFIVYFEHISDLVLVFLLLTLNM